MAIERRQIKSKAVMFYVLQSYPETKDYLPHTEVLEYRALRKMMGSYNKIYLKPDQGCKSKGVIRIEKTENGLYLIRKSESEELQEFHKFPELWKNVQLMTSHTRHIIQKGIECVTKDQRNFDIRAHVLRVRGEWTVGGICVRLGAPGSIVTTSLIGGTPIQLDTLFTDMLGYSDEDQQQVKEKLHDCILNTAKKISPVYPKNKEFGIDMGLDAAKQVWLYEVNTAPLVKGNFKLLHDLTLFERITSLRKISK